MGKTRHIFKNFEIKEYHYFDKIEFDDDIGESICYSNATQIQEVFSQVNLNIPVIETYYELEENITREFIESELISPSKVVKACEILLSNIKNYIQSEDSENYIIDAIKYILDKSNEGYYIVFEND